MVVIKAGMHYGCLPQPDCIVVAQKLLIGTKRRSNKELHISPVCTSDCLSVLLVRSVLVTASLKSNSGPNDI